MTKEIGKCENGNISDGYHTFDELYNHRHHLFVALMCSNPEISWRATNHYDETYYEGYFVAGMHLPTGDISYHLPLSMWEILDYSGIESRNSAPKLDGHTSNDVLTRLANWCNQASGWLLKKQKKKQSRFVKERSVDRNSTNNV